MTTQTSSSFQCNSINTSNPSEYFIINEPTVTKDDLLVFLQVYFTLAKHNIPQIFQDLSIANKYSSFWLNFSLNFYDKTFCDLIQSNEDIEKLTYIKKTIKEIIDLLDYYLNIHFGGDNIDALSLEKKLMPNLELICYFHEIIYQFYNTDFISIEQSLTFKKCYENMITYSSLKDTATIDIIDRNIYQHVGFSFLDFKGNFYYADAYSSDVLFKQDNIRQKNIFDIMSEHSKFILKQRFGDNLFDFSKEDMQVFVFKYTIIDKEKEEKLIKEKNLSNLFETLNSYRTLISRASVILLTQKDSDTCRPLILLETKISQIRQNFDYITWSNFFN